MIAAVLTNAPNIVNRQLRWEDKGFLCVTIAGVMFSAFVNLKAARVTTGKLKKMFTLTGILALFYIPLYASAFLSWLDTADWSSFMLGLSWIVWWGAPWSSFALFALNRDRVLRETLGEMEDAQRRLRDLEG